MYICRIMLGDYFKMDVDTFVPVRVRVASRATQPARVLCSQTQHSLLLFLSPSPGERPGKYLIDKRASAHSFCRRCVPVVFVQLMWQAKPVNLMLALINDRFYRFSTWAELLSAETGRELGSVRTKNFGPCGHIKRPGLSDETQSACLTLSVGLTCAFVRAGHAVPTSLPVKRRAAVRIDVLHPVIGYLVMRYFGIMRDCKSVTACN